MSDTSTRSGMLWEVERILTECQELGELPQILIMENVPMVHSSDNSQDFNKWQLRLEELGYKNYWQDMIATDYGIPQTRNRTFMVSILGDYNYTFPNPIPLKLKLKDMLEDEVNDKYYLSDKMKNYIFSEDSKYKVNQNNLQLNREIACTKTTREGRTRADTSDYITKDIKIIGHISQWHQRGYIYDENNSMTTICATDYKTPKLVATKSKELKIRKLTPKECFRLMGVKDDDFDKAAKNQSDSSLYHLAGDSIVVQCLMAIYRRLINE